MAEVEKQRHAIERGNVIRILFECYRTPMTTIGTIAGSLDALGVPVATETLQFHLVYLADSGYVQIWRNRDMVGWRSDRDNAGSPDAIRFAKLLPKGLRLLDGNEPADSQVRF